MEEAQPRKPVPGDVCAVASMCRTQPDCKDLMAGYSVVPHELGWLSPAPKLTLFAFQWNCSYDSFVEGIFVLASGP